MAPTSWSVSALPFRCQASSSPQAPTTPSTSSSTLRTPGRISVAGPFPPWTPSLRTILAALSRSELHSLDSPLPASGVPGSCSRKAAALNHLLHGRPGRPEEPGSGRGGREGHREPEAGRTTSGWSRRGAPAEHGGPRWGAQESGVSHRRAAQPHVLRPRGGGARRPYRTRA